MLLSVAALAQAQNPAPLGRLFSTPAQRAELDARRNAADQPQAMLAAPPAPAPAPAALPPPVELNGLVQRSSGRSTVWLNQQAQQEPYNRLAPEQAQQEPYNRLAPEQGGTLTLQLSNGQSVLLRPGQRYDPLRRQVVEAAGGRP
ncbi:hypothetical protein [Janthinobacterium aquaticum]|uniref:hypothetical protein n=1 Tax=Janthinobacterium sp. FT58W TaxID=2654254 RepID=UPI001264F979|nr:hypothetical protein [Janthinobacterium sp. FT58W]KAB8045011.1 hypothetical protein GCM43_00800 [Janthinobacterium sp. FT58W]